MLNFITSTVLQRSSCSLIFLTFLRAPRGRSKDHDQLEYRNDDDTMQEAGEDFEEDLSHCCYNLVVI